MENISFFKIVHKENSEAKDGEYTIPCYYPLEYFVAKQITKEEAEKMWKETEKVWIKETYYISGLRENKQPIPENWNWEKKERNVLVPCQKLDCEIGHIDSAGFAKISWDSIVKCNGKYFVDFYIISGGKKKIEVSSFDEAIEKIRQPLYCDESILIEDAESGKIDKYEKRLVL